MENPITFTMLNDFVFCPASIYFHGLYEDVMDLLYTGEKQLKGKAAHKKIDENNWTQSKVLCSIPVYSTKYNLMGKIDKYYPDTKELMETKRTIKTIYDGYIFQLYAQYFAMKESGFEVCKLALYSKTDNKKYKINLPEDDHAMLDKFEQNLCELRGFDFAFFEPTNVEKCMNCIYSNACPWGENFD